MITRISDYLKKSIPGADVCIVGAGAAGLELALALSESSLSVILLESGYEEYDWQVQKLCRLEQKGRRIRSADHDSFFGLDVAERSEARLRQFGGTLNIWGGRWKTLDRFDLQAKPFIQDKGWPLDYEELSRYYHKIAERYEIAELMQVERAPFSLFPSSSFSSGAYLLQGVRTDIHSRFYMPLQSSKVRVILGANVVDIRLSNDLQKVDHLVVRSMEGHEQPVEANCMVLACGTMENARLLLASNRQIHTGIGNQSGWVGKNLIDHLKGRAYLTLFPQHTKGLEHLTRKIGSKTIGYDIKIHPQLLKEWDLPNHSLWILRTAENFVYKCRFVLEQLPNPDSRFYLSEKRDALGMPIGCTDWKFREEDRLCYLRFVEKMNQLLKEHQIGTLSCYEMEQYRDCSHQLGTTRMSFTPEEGVADNHGKVFGINNLFLLGSSLFPSGGNANPTFTILALARRLGDYLLRSS
ncbi:MAG: FAD-binding protein [Parachlamydia sp.]|nr:FAD-binding protein [Parachlamydia sp.]